MLSGMRHSMLRMTPSLTRDRMSRRKLLQMFELTSACPDVRARSVVRTVVEAFAAIAAGPTPAQMVNAPVFRSAPTPAARMDAADCVTDAWADRRAWPASVRDARTY